MIIIGNRQDLELDQQLLGLVAPWTVKRVTLKPTAQEVVVEVACQQQRWGCPSCGERMQVHGWERRRWRHLDRCQFKSVLEAEVPRLKCAAHGSQVAAEPWAEKHGRFTRLFERPAIDSLSVCST